MASRDTASTRAEMNGQPSRAGGLLLGLGLGGFVDGIVMHQILQWHHLVSNVEPTNTVAGLEVNTLADGFFHAAALLLTLGGIIVTLAHWRQGRLPPGMRRYWGNVVLGVGVFNIADSIVNHWLVGSHHVRDDLGGPLSWDVGFFVLSVAVTLAGWALAHRGR